MENSKQIFNSLPEKEKLLLIEKVMPHSGTYRQLEEEGCFSNGQINQMVDIFVKSINWEVEEEFEKLSVHDIEVSIIGIDNYGNKYRAMAILSCGEIEDITDIEKLE
jgi:hypothetical protein